jgi:hypothetical protein
MLLQTNSYIVPKEKRSEHARLLRRFRQTLLRLGCDHFEVYEQVGANWSGAEATGRFVQIMRFRDRKHQQQIQAAERQDPVAQQLIAEFCALINFPYQQQQGLFAVGFYRSALPVASPRVRPAGGRPPGDGAAGDPSQDDLGRQADVTATAGSSASAPPAAAAAEGASLLDIATMGAPDAGTTSDPETPAPGAESPESSHPDALVEPEAVEDAPGRSDSDGGDRGAEGEDLILEGLTFDDPERPPPPRDDTVEPEPQAR